MRRAWDLTRRRFWWVVGFVLILALFAQLIVTAPVSLIGYGLLFAFGENPFQPSGSLFVTHTIIQSITSLVFSLIYVPLQLTAMTLMYFDLRVRTEGFDLDILSASTAQEQADLSEVIAQAPASENSTLVTWNEMGYFALIEIGALALYFLVVALFGAIAVGVMGAA